VRKVAGKSMIGIEKELLIFLTAFSSGLFFKRNIQMPGMLPGYCETFVSRSRNRGLVLLDFCGNVSVCANLPH